MAALSLGQGKDVKSFIADFTGSQRYIMDYLIEEVLERQSEEVQELSLEDFGAGTADRSVMRFCHRA